MGAPDLLVHLHAIGVSVIVERGALLVRPASALTPDLRHAIRANKPELMDIAPRRYWTISVPGREPFGGCCVQCCTRDELLARYPAGTEAVPL